MRSLLSLFFLVSYFLAAAQQQDSILLTNQLKEVSIKYIRPTLGVFQPVYKLDSSLKSFLPAADLNDLLQYSSPVILKQSGFGGAQSSAAMRGAGYDHTMVYWNGFPLNSITLGGADVSNIPAGIGEVSVQQGATGVEYGGGTFGGTIDLSSSFTTNNYARVNLGFGSFKQFRQSVEVNQDFGKTKIQAFIYRKTGENNFIYNNDFKPKAAIDTANHNGLNEVGGTLNLQRELNKQVVLEAGVWLMQKTKEIPLTKSQYAPIYNLKQLDDDFGRAYISLRNKNERSKWNFRAAYFNDKLLYSDFDTKKDDYFIYSKTEQQKAFTVASYRLIIGNKITIHQEIQHQYLQAKVDNYQLGKINENRIFFFQHGTITYKKLTTNIGYRIEKQPNAEVVFIPQFRMRYDILPSKIGVFAQVNKNFRAPDFNEKYWQPGGNLNLLNEYGWAQTFGFDGKFSVKEEVDFTFSLEGYHHFINNMIIWVPENGFSTPKNTKAVETLGLTLNVNPSVSVFNKKGSISLQVLYNYMSAKNVSIFASQSEVSIGRPPIYSPKTTSKSVLKLNYRKVTAFAAWQYIGERFFETTYTKFALLPAYGLLNGGVSVNTNPSKKANTNLSMTINNILNTPYEAVRNYAVPGRYYMLNLTITLK